VLVQEELAKRQGTVLPHPPDSSDLAPRNFFLFPHLKEKLIRSRLQSAEEIVTATRELYGPFLQYRSVVFPAAILTLADLHFEGRCGYV
jgi:hypothetical protein